MHLGEQHNKDNYQMVEFMPNKSELCDICHGSGSNGDGTCSSCNGTGVI